MTANAKKSSLSADQESKMLMEIFTRSQTEIQDSVHELRQGMAELTTDMRLLIAELRHTNENYDNLTNEVDDLKKKVRILELDGAKRQTKINLIVAAFAAIGGSLITFFVSKM